MVNIADPFAEVQIETVKGLQQSLLTHMPASAYRDFFDWALSSRNPQLSTYLQVMGITQLCKMTTRLVDGLIDDAQWPQFIPYCVAMNVYQIYEIVSDNLAIGLARKRADDTMSSQRHTLLYNFNLAMMKRLRGAPDNAEALLKDFALLTDCISGFDQSLNPDLHVGFARSYINETEASNLGHLEYSVWDVLVANIESAVDLANFWSDNPVGDIFLDTLVKRYWGVNQLLAGIPLTLPQLADVGTYTILVAPTLAYYVGALSTIAGFNDRLQTLVDDGLVRSALLNTALLVRLLNDLGTWIARSSDDEREDLLEKLRLSYQAHPGVTIDELLINYNETPTLTRIHKDITHGEFNVGLHGLTNIKSTAAALGIFRNNIAYFANRYQNSYQQLKRELDIITQRLGNTHISEMLMRFVKFHEALYSNAYTESDGEYAI